MIAVYWLSFSWFFGSWRSGLVYATFSLLPPRWSFTKSASISLLVDCRLQSRSEHTWFVRLVVLVRLGSNSNSRRYVWGPSKRTCRYCRNETEYDFTQTDIRFLHSHPSKSSWACNMCERRSPSLSNLFTSCQRLTFPLDLSQSSDSLLSFERSKSSPIYSPL